MPTDPRVYITVDVGMPENRKIVGLSDRAFRQIVELWCTCGELAHEGTISRAELHRSVAPRARRELLDSGIIAERPDGRIILDTTGLFGGWHRRRGRPHISDTVRFMVYRRDGWACRTCGSCDYLTLDHIYPWSLGGSDGPENLQTLCQSCNSRKGVHV